MRAAAIAIAMCVVLGVWIVHYSDTRAQDTEWVACTLAYPGSGYSSKADFIRRGGRFGIEVLTPMTEQETRQNVGTPPVATNLRFLITGPKRFRTENVIHSLSDVVWTLPSGDFHVQVTGDDDLPAYFRTRGAVLQLRRLEDVGPGLLIDISKYLGYTLLGFAIGMAGAIALRKSS